MKIIRYICSLLVFIVAVKSYGQNYVPGEVIVKLKKSTSSSAQKKFFGKAQSEKQMELRRSYGKMKLYHFASKMGKSVEQMIQELEADPDVEYVEPNYLFSKKDLNGFEQTFSSEEIVTLANSESGYLATNAKIEAQSIWNSLSDSSSTPIVGIIDTGLDVDHPVFTSSGALWTNPEEIPDNGIDDDGNGYIDDVHGWNFVHNSGYMLDDDGHGTHVAGIVLGVGQDIFTPPFDQAKIRIMPLKFLDANGIGTTSDAINAIYYAIQNGASVLNNSWGGPNYSGALHEAVVYSYENGVTFVAAAGNSGSNNDFTPMYPASYDVPHVMSVAATTDLDYLATFSNFGSSSVDIGSPGVFILSTIPGGGYGSSSGTSMATPFVSGVAALMIHESPSMLGYQVKNIIFDQADSIMQLGEKVATESRINVQSAVVVAKSTSVEAQQPNYSFTNQDRELASALSGGGGCGLVSKMYSDMTKNGRGGSGPMGGSGPWYIIIILGIIALPLMMAQYLKSQLPENKRKHQRFKIDSEVKVNVGGRELVGAVSSISMGGVRIDTNALLEQGSVVSMTISSPDGKDQIEVKGNIVWSESQKAYGVQFQETTDTLKSKISSWTKALKPMA